MFAVKIQGPVVQKLVILPLVKFKSDVRADCMHKGWKYFYTNLVWINSSFVF